MPVPSDSEKPGRGRHPNSLANLRGGRNQHTWQKGDTTHLVHGGRSRLAPAIYVEPLVEEIVRALGADMPIADERFSYVVQLAANDLLTYRRVSAWFQIHDIADGKGRLRVRELEYLTRASNGLREHLRELGLTPAGYAQLGVDVARGQREAEEAAAHQEKARLAREAADRRNGVVDA
jgi:hypothetical protein